MYWNTLLIDEIQFNFDALYLDSSWEKKCSVPSHA